MVVTATEVVDEGYEKRKQLCLFGSQIIMDSSRTFLHYKALHSAEGILKESLVQVTRIEASLAKVQTCQVP